MSEVNQRLNRFLSQEPQIDCSAYISKDATIIGAVTIGAHSSVWPQCVLRGDINSIEIGEGTNVQDGSVIHLADDYGVRIGNNTTIGHMAMVHACTIGNECLIGMHSTILDGAVIGSQCIIGAHTLITQGMQIPDGSLVMGVPGKIVKTLDHTKRSEIKNWAKKYIQVAAAHKVKAAE